jgi:chemotaxis protein histidine kinase CheA
MLIIRKIISKKRGAYRNNFIFAALINPKKFNMTRSKTKPQQKESILTVLDWMSQKLDEHYQKMRQDREEAEKRAEERAQKREKEEKKERKEKEEKAEKERKEKEEKAEKERKEKEEKAEKERKEKEEKAEKERKEKEEKAEKERKEKEEKAEKERKEKEEKAEKDWFKFEKSIEAIHKEMGGIGLSNGEMAESYFYNSFDKSMKFAGQKYDVIDRNYKRKDKRLNLKGEYDIILYNCSSVAIIETKYKARKDHVENLMNKAPVFKQFFPKFANFDIYLGLAAFHFEADTENEAINQGIAVIKQIGDNMVVNDKYLKVF